jgi:hypothetical protein
VHGEFLCGLALVASVSREDLKDVTLFEFADSIGVCNAGGVHLED